MKIKPLTGYVFLEPIEKDNKTKAGIILPDSGKEGPVTGKVVAVSQGAAVGLDDIVVFRKYGPDEVEIDGKKYLVAEEKDIMAILL